MPYCSQCGNTVGTADTFCGRCGARQPVSAPGAPGDYPRAADPLTGISPRTASILCYIPWMGWIAAIVVLSADRFRRDRTVRFHAFQGLYLFVAWLLNQYVLRWVWSPIPHMGIYGLVALILLFAAIFMMVKAAHDEAYSLPIIGELAARSVAED
ncbi:MAG: hypothetical protein LAQ30_11275, partial [Acidobacteriia bacterium]|nr:hypothetical protein [Terriglobia bacterium]